MDVGLDKLEKEHNYGLKLEHSYFKVPEYNFRFPSTMNMTNFEDNTTHVRAPL